MDLPYWLKNPDSSYFQGDNYIVLDFETTNHEAGHARNKNNQLLLACWILGPDHPMVKRGSALSDTIYTHWGNQYQQQQLVQCIAEADFIVAHNAKFELQWLALCGVDLYSVRPFCTQVAEYIRLGNRKAPLDLDSVLTRWGLSGKDNFIKTLLRGGVCPSQMPRSLLEKYCGVDVTQTTHLFRKMRSKLSTSVWGPLTTRNSSLPMMAALEFVGLTLTEDVERVYGENLKELQDNGKTFQTLTGGINFNSGKQKGEYLYDVLKFEEPLDHKGKPIRTPPSKRFPEGQPKTDKETIALLKAKTPEQKEFKRLALQLSQLEADHELLTKLRECYNTNNGILYFNYNPTVTRTLRLSSAGGEFKIQGQNIPRKFKFLFGPRNKDWRIGEADYAQLEFRVAGHYGRDKRLLEDVLSGLDAHAFSAEVFGIDRQSAKAETFRPLFGSKGQTPKQKKYAIEFRKRWQGVDRIQKYWAEHCVKHGYVQTETGLKFYWPAEVTRSGWITYTTKIYDYPIQYLAGGEITLIACTMLWYLTRGMKSFLINTIHDSIIFEVHPDEEEELEELQISTMTEGVYTYLKKMYNIDFFIPLGVETKFGEAWSRGKGTKVDVLQDGTRIYREIKGEKVK